jgi:hypothetical protein
VRRSVHACPADPLPYCALTSSAEEATMNA